MDPQHLAEDLKSRGLVEHEGGGTLSEILGASRKVYLGIDPTADSLHVGNLVSVLLMRRLSEAGHKVFFLVGGGTGMIGDPRESGERPLLDEKTIRSNTRSLERQIAQLIGKRVKIFDNAKWLRRLGAIEFLRDVGKHFTVNQLIKRDIIKRRLDTEDSISFTEFSYSLLQAYDFLYLYRKYGIDLQVGGSDQWANIISGVDLIRRKEAKSAYALTAPIIMDRKSGKKFGKSEGNAVWLDSKKTKPFDFYQFWFNVSDEGVEEYLKIFTLLSIAQIEGIMRTHRGNPAARAAQKTLAYEVTKLVHGAEEADRVKVESFALFKSASSETFSPEVFDQIPDSESVTMEVEQGRADQGIPLVDLLLESGLATSKRDARQLVSDGAVSVNGEKMTDPSASISSQKFVGGKLLLKKGKRDVRIVSLK